MTVYYADFDLGDGANDGTSWANALRTEAAWEAFLEGTVAAADIIYIMQSTCTADSAWDFSARDGSATAPITFIGVKDGTTATPPTIADWSDANLSGGADDRPTMAMGALVFTHGDYVKAYNIIYTGTGTSVAIFGTGVMLYNCKGVNSSSTNDRKAIDNGTGSRNIHCEGAGLVGTQVVCTAFDGGTDSVFLFCRAHDCRTGILATGVGTQVLSSIAEDCSVAGIDMNSRNNFTILNNSINDCAVGISGTTAAPGICINNILEGCTTDGIIWTTQSDSNFFWNNHGDDARNNDMWDGVLTTDPHGDLAVTTGDPKFTADGNLSLQSDSPCIDAGMAMVLGVG